MAVKILDDRKHLEDQAIWTDMQVDTRSVADAIAATGLNPLEGRSQQRQLPASLRPPRQASINESKGSRTGTISHVLQVLVERLRWLSSGVFLELLALCQCLPGPSSTQLSFALGITQQGAAGGLLSGETLFLIGPRSRLLGVPVLSVRPGKMQQHGSYAMSMADAL